MQGNVLDLDVKCSTLLSPLSYLDMSSHKLSHICKDHISDPPSLSSYLQGSQALSEIPPQLYHDRL